MKQYTFVVTLNSGSDEFWEEAEETDGESIEGFLRELLTEFDFDYNGFMIRQNHDNICLCSCDPCAYCRNNED